VTFNAPLYNLTHALDGLTVFPDASHVFAEPVVRYRKYLHALLSIELSLVNPTWTGCVHLLNPVEPYDGCLADDTLPAHTETCKQNWLSCKLDANNRYTLLADFDFFALGSRCAVPRWPEYQNELAKTYDQAEKDHLDCQARYQTYGGLYRGKRFKPLEKDDPQSDPKALLEQLGGHAPDGNWADNSAIEVLHDPARGLVPRVTGADMSAINDFHFIASVPGYHYRSGSADTLLLFYSPSTRIATHTFDWT
jgi:hypothetical protein